MRALAVVAILVLSGCATSTLTDELVDEPESGPYRLVRDADAPLLNNLSAQQLHSVTATARLDGGGWSLFHLALTDEKYNDGPTFDGEASFWYEMKINGSGRAVLVELLQDASVFNGELEPPIYPRAQEVNLDDGEARLLGGRGLQVIGGSPSSFTFPLYEFVWLIWMENAGTISFAAGEDVGQRPPMPVSPFAVGSDLGFGLVTYEWDGTELAGKSSGSLSFAQTGGTLPPEAYATLQQTLRIVGAMHVDAPGFMASEAHIWASQGVIDWRYDVPGAAAEGIDCEGELTIPCIAIGQQENRVRHSTLVEPGEHRFDYQAVLTGLGRQPNARPIEPVEAVWVYAPLNPYELFGWPQ